MPTTALKMPKDISRNLARKVQLAFSIINVLLFASWVLAALLLLMRASIEEAALFVVCAGSVLVLMVTLQLFCCWVPGQRKLFWNTWFLQWLQTTYCRHRWCTHAQHQPQFHAFVGHNNNRPRDFDVEK